MSGWMKMTILAVAMVVVVVISSDDGILYGSSSEDEGVVLAQKKVAVGKKAEKSDRSTPAVSDKEIEKLMKSMNAKNGKKRESRTRRIQDKILSTKAKLAELKLKSSKSFAKWEKFDEEAESAKTKAISLHEVYEQEREQEHMQERKLDRLKDKLTKHLTGFNSRNDLEKYYNKLHVEAAETVPKSIKAEDKTSTLKAAAYRKRMEAKNTQSSSITKAKTSKLSEIPNKVNVWDTEETKKVERVERAVKKLHDNGLEADRVLLKSSEK